MPAATPPDLALTQPLRAAPRARRPAPAARQPTRLATRPGRPRHLCARAPMRAAQQASQHASPAPHARPPPAPPGVSSSPEPPAQQRPQRARAAPAILGPRAHPCCPWPPRRPQPAVCFSIASPGFLSAKSRDVMLNGKNYKAWSSTLCVLLHGLYLWDHVDGTRPPPVSSSAASSGSSSSTVTSAPSSTSTNLLKCTEDDAHTIAIICQSCELPIRLVMFVIFLTQGDLGSSARTLSSFQSGVALLLATDSHIYLSM
ncbi:proline-rich receptor-like protein kinase PERK10 [Dioscorea cayenensis subsp. rotundata]|uniref:Proline-rich receptor-like protein kinase PERK10 n=1 Tax=Dioscorea cayennensis subsp. rotundata TaxID=55577 RepID=A0AB40B0E0_DIOCR|nr:proline-rich receptor-like protein kinase PERK10 [Dioscorea cayenensis subsp. rotundata]